MYARVWKLVILPGKVDEFAAAVKSGLPIVRRQAGFCGVLVLRSGPGERLEATVLSLWSSLEALRDSETGAFQHALADVLSKCEPRPFMREEEVLVSDFPHRGAASADSNDTVTSF